MRKLKIVITKILKQVYPDVFYESAHDDAPYPYLVYAFGSGFNNRHNEIIPLDVDIWDLNESSQEIDEIMTELKRLDGKCYTDEDMQFSLYYDRTLDTSPEDRNHKRMNVTFELRYHERRV